MIFFRRRLFIWLLRAYVKKWGLTILLFFVVGLALFFLLLKAAIYLIPKIPIGQRQTIGMVGAYTLDTLPSSLLTNLSHGLTAISGDGTIVPDLAKSWNIRDNGKTYIFTLKDNVFFSDGTPFTSDQITLPFSDVSIERPNKMIIVFHLKEVYSPFLTTVAHPIFKKGFVGVGEYRIQQVKINGNFVESITLSSTRNQYSTKTYHFYPSQEALKMAYALGDITSAVGLSSLSFQLTSFDHFPNTRVQKNVDYNRLITLFYNVTDPTLSDVKIRSALTYALPDHFTNGERNYTPYPPFFWANDPLQNARQQDLAHANLLITQSQSATKGSHISLSIKTFPEYKNDAKMIAKIWEQLGFRSSIEIVTTIPGRFQVFLGDFILPKDPDQYMLWHSSQGNNITQYNNQRIDKLLEDGRETLDFPTREKIYSDFQKYLLADSPASFLYFPYEYEISRK